MAPALVTLVAMALVTRSVSACRGEEPMGGRVQRDTESAVSVSVNYILGHQ